MRPGRVPAGAAALLLGAACGGGPRIVLRYHPPAGATYRFTLEQRQELRMESGSAAAIHAQQLVVMRMHFRQAVAGPAPDGHGTTVRITFDSTRMEMPGLPPAMEGFASDRLRGLEATVLFDDRAQVVRTDFAPSPGIPPDMAEQMAAGVKMMGFAMPAEPVGRGDSWTVTTELPMTQLPGTSSGSGAARTRLTVRTIRIAAGTPPDTLVVLDVRTSFPEEPIPIEFQGRRATLRLSGTLTGEQTFSITRGTIVRGDLGGTIRMQVSGGGLGQQAMRSDTRTTLRLVGQS